MAIHVVCLDGTGQTYDQQNPTNISLIFKSMGGTIVDAQNGSFESTYIFNKLAVQYGKYLPGVGTSGIALFDFIARADGEGIAEQIVRGYTFLSRNFTIGDEIIIVGFSRGAAAARCLAGFVVKQGLLDPTKFHTEDKAAAYLRGIAAWYKYRSNRPDLVRYANLTDMFGDLNADVPPLSDDDFVTVERILAVAVFDTVSSLGLPKPALNGLSYDFSLADTVLNPKVLNGIQALAADENRDNFFPTFWTPRHKITQVIFPGSHSDVGGGYPEIGLSDRALQWMLTQLQAQGVRCDPQIIRTLQPLATAVGHDEAILPPWNLLPMNPRTFPADLFEGLPAFMTDRSIGERWGKSITLLPGQRQSPYQAIGCYAGNRLLYP